MESTISWATNRLALLSWRMLKSKILFGFCLLIVCRGSAQINSSQHPSVLSLHVVLYDFQKEGVFTGANKDAGLGVSFLQGINQRYDYVIQANLAYTDSVSKSFRRTTGKKAVVQLDLSIRTRLFTPIKRFNPFIQSGFGLSYFQSYTATFFSFGPGFEFTYKDIFLKSSFQYRLPFTANLNTHFFYTIGIED
jgi:hypothetical protein